MLIPAIRCLPRTAVKGSKARGGAFHLRCWVKPGSKREGIVSVSDHGIEVCVAAQARDGEANKAVREVIAKVLGLPKSDIDIAKGTKSREKTVVIDNPNLDISNMEQEMAKIMSTLQESVGS